MTTKTVVVTWALTVVTLVCVALTVAFWTECNASDTDYRDFQRPTSIDRGWRAVSLPNGGYYLCRPRVYRLFGY